MTSHLLAFEDLAWILTLTSRTVGTVRYGYAVSSASTTEVVAFHGTGEAFTNRRTNNIHMLTSNIMVRSQLSSNLNEVLFAYTEFSKFTFRFYLRYGEMAAHRLRNILYFGFTHTQLKGGIAVFLYSTLSNNLAILNLENRNRNMFAGFGINAGHSQLLCDHTRTHGYSCLSLTLELNFYVHTGRKI